MRRFTASSRAFTSVMKWDRWRASNPGRAVAVAVAASLVASMSQLPDPRPVQAAKPTSAPADSGAPLERPDEAAALVTARLTGKRVKITGLTTETDDAWAEPKGSVSLEHRFRPVCVKRDGGWVPVDTTLAARDDGTIAPKAAAVDVAFSGGGAGPLVKLVRGEDRLAVGSPLGKLPKPVLDGNAATYPNVLPGVDLQVRADVDGFAQTLVVKDRNAARHPKLAKLTFPTTSGGLAVKTDKAGNLKLVGSTGRLAFTGATPMMWDADAEPAAVGQPSRVGAGPAANPDPDQVAMAVAATASALSVTPNQAMLSDADTTFPVYIDPGFTATRSAWAMVNYGSPDSAYWNYPDDAYVGSWDGGLTRWRSMFNYPTADTPIAGKHIISATMNLYQKWSSTCAPSQFQVYALAAAATSSTTWANQPDWEQLIAAPTEAKGYSPQGLGGPSECPAAALPISVTSATQAAATTGATMALGLRATDETDSNSWKRFDNNPTLSITYTAYPTVGARSTTPDSVCATGASRPYLNSMTPTLGAVIGDAEGASSKAEFEWSTAGGARIGGAITEPSASGTTKTATIPAGQFDEGGSYSWRVRGHDGITWGDWSTSCEFTVDTIAPGAATVTSTTYPKDQWAGRAGTGGSFTFDPAGVADVASYLYGLDVKPPATAINAASLGGSATVSITPDSDGPHTLYVQSRDRAGNLSPATAYTFNVGDGAVTNPTNGDISAGRTVLHGVGQPQATGVTYQWRRGDADAWADIPAADVALADGGSAVTWPVPTSGNGQFPKLNWNLEKTVNDAEAGPDPLDGPLQIRAVYAGATGGTPTPVKISLDRDQASAASTEIGPGSVNLLTGSFSTGQTDAQAASLGVGRVYNSRQAQQIDPMFGPGWVSSIAVPGAEANRYTGLDVTDSLVQVGLANGDVFGFAKKATTSSGATFEPQVGAQDYTLAYAASGDVYTLSDGQGNEAGGARVRPRWTPQRCSPQHSSPMATRSPVRCPPRGNAPPSPRWTPTAGHSTWSPPAGN